MNRLVSIRPAALNDADRILGWRNDPFILERSSSRKSVSNAEHEAWIRKVLADPCILMYIIETDNLPAGLLRYEYNPHSEDCVVSVYIVEKFTGHGIGTRALHIGADQVWNKWPAKRIVAHVREDNHIGQRAFIRAGFTPADQAIECPPRHLAYVQTRSKL
jgi:UDP-2,4-diacetamido-2,4,6-trideoxy-beta-L-altropyranose hydrolase